MFQECQRKYYFHYYYLRADEGELDEITARNVRFLRKLINRYMLMGQVLHQEIDRWVAAFQRGTTLPLSRVLQAAWEEFDVRYKFSFREHYFYRPEHDPHYTVLFEHVYKIPITHVALGKMYQMLKKALRNLTLWPGFQRIQLLDANRVVFKEEMLRGTLGEIPVWLRIDLGYRELNGKIVLIDWKFSEAPEPKDQLQLAIYGAYAREKFPEVEAIELANVYLLSGTEKRYWFTDDLFQQTQAVVAQSYQQMQAFENKIAEGLRLKHLPPTFRAEVCQWCNFRKLCFPRGFPQQKMVHHHCHVKVTV